ncbi:lipid asymmetry maintenance ABC transporter permease subunit MlaE [Candidatus Kinetoplastidibacterium crithidiae]|uniref:Intermembrane phospholipid transport system permease protein MlaE n=1 Tax=Candidatus Kinetoplastidibacterium crithidiae TCC036E TaxID=1208918 RepID=M1M595_9PROT|nr:lipid asymmetry maintenance ABC transporter permease subunit MlaE [Candidatus Kinetoplastibacterium crithidii]AGF47335.1 ABC transport system permease protein [Candidatus Kinetoplastibacterium crithidii TCC036E]
MTIISDMIYWIYRITSNIGRFICFFIKILSCSSVIFQRPKLLIKQIFVLGNKSILITVISGLFIGCILGLQGYYVLNKYKAEDVLGFTIALALVRELSPVVTAMVFIGRAGTAMTAETAFMKAEEQIIAMEIMAINPAKIILAPRFWAGTISVPLLSLIFSVSGIIGGWTIGVILSGIDQGVFWSQIQYGISLKNDILNGLIKSIIFGIVASLISLYEGWESRSTPEGVSESITNSVVNGYLSILAINFLLTIIMFTK